jgi:predicted nucleic acid-binding protein
MIDVVFDACVLYSASLRDLLMNIAVEDVVRAHWSDEIHDEWIRSLLRNQPTLNQESLERTRLEMDDAIEGGLVRGYEHLIPTLELPDANDRHVLALALHVRAKWIVTKNLKDFPKQKLLPHKVEAISPDDFICCALEIDREGVLLAAKKHRLKLKRPPKTIDQYLETLRQQGLAKTVAFLEEYRSEIGKNF